MLQNTSNVHVCGRVEFEHCGQRLLPTVTTQTTQADAVHTPQGKKGTEIRPINIPAYSVTASYLHQTHSGLQTKCLKNTQSLEHPPLTQSTSNRDLISRNKDLQFGFTVSLGL